MLSESERQILIDALQEVRFLEGDKIIKQGEEGKAFYIIKSGTVCVSAGCVAVAFVRRTPSVSRRACHQDGDPQGWDGHGRLLW